MSIRFHIPNFTTHYHVNLLLIKMIKEYPQYFIDGLEIGSVYGEFPPSLWNGGRYTAGVCNNKNDIKYILKSFNDLGVPIRFTFTNPVLEKKHLMDKHCNLCLSLANNGFNEVIVCSPILEQYIRNNYPKYQLISSTCKEIRDFEILKQELEKDYKYVVLDYNWNNDFEHLEQLDHKDKCEILVNACCQPNCQRRGEHYRVIGETQIKYIDHMNKYPNVPFEGEDFPCDHTASSIFEVKDSPLHVSQSDIVEKYAPMGFSNFKIEGRSFHLFNLVETYMYYMAKPEYRDLARYTLLLSLQQNNVITTHTIFD